MKIHLIAIGGSAMHNLALALHFKGYTITGSDDQIFEPSKSRLKKHGLLPKNIILDSELPTTHSTSLEELVWYTPTATPLISWIAI